MRKFGLFLVLVLCLTAVMPTFAQDPTAEPVETVEGGETAPAAGGTIADMVMAAAGGDPAEFTILLQAVQAADPELLALLQDPTAGVTVFAPTDAAFTAAMEATGMTAEDLLGNSDVLHLILGYHVVPYPIDSATLMGLGDVYVGTFVPDAALHIVSDGTSVTINDTTTVIHADMMADGGVIHAIDSVLMPPALIEMMMAVEGAEPVATEEAAEGTDPMAAEGSIADLAMAAAAGDPAEFSLLVGAIQAVDAAMPDAQLVSALSGTLPSGEQPITVFAPNDAAFNALMTEQGITAEMLPDVAQLIAPVLLYHVVPGWFSASYLMELAGMTPEGANILTVIGAPVTVTTDGTSVMVNCATVTQPDMFASNGVIHTIDTVLLPE